MKAFRTAALLVALSAATASLADPVVFVVRHAEKVDESEDPDLSPSGRTRALAIAGMLRDAGIQAVYSTDFIRTRETARPTADLVGKPVQTYDRAEGLVKDLRARGERALVVGHSNTVPDLVRALGGEPGPEIASDEYDRLYLLVLGADGRAETTILRLPSGDPR